MPKSMIIFSGWGGRILAFTSGYTRLKASGVRKLKIYSTCSMAVEQSGLNASRIDLLVTNS